MASQQLQHQQQVPSERQAPPWMDLQTLPLPPCTMETLPEPVMLANGRRMWPLMVGCYRLLQQTTTESSSTTTTSSTPPDGTSQQDVPAPREVQQASSPPALQQARAGQLNLYPVMVPDVSSNLPAMPLALGEPQIVLNPKNSPSSSGILDGKWSAMSLDGLSSSSSSSTSWAYATAHSNGEIQVHAMRVLTEEERLSETDPFFQVTPVGKSSSASVNGHSTSSAPTPLCLSLNWNHYCDTTDHHNSNERQIVSSYSNGRVAVYDVLFSSQPSTARNNKRLSCQLVERESWAAHSLFTSPSEVWSSCFCTTHLIASGGDDGTIKFWDVRSTNRPTQVLHQPFTAGVTCLSPHPRLEHLVAAGSYDECLALYDVRHTPVPLLKTKPLGGGIWRLQWHPVNDRRLLVAAMHGGCRVLQCRGLSRYCGTDTNSPSSTLQQHPPPQPQHHHRYDATSYLHPHLSSPSFGSEISNNTTTTSWSTEAGGDPHQMVRCKVKKSFTEHDSIVYGSSWLVCRHPKHLNSYFEAAASCSFYDQTLMVWDSVF